MKKHIQIIFVATSFIFASFATLDGPAVFVSNAGVVKIKTKGPLGVINATSKKLDGSLDAAKKTFSFSIPVTSFEGFQNSLQKTHFNEKYMESEKIPFATFKGKIIEAVDLAIPGTYPVRAKGSMKIHDVEKEMIIKSKITVKAGGIIAIESSFNVLLEDFKIKIPTIVNQKVDEDIAIEVKMDMATKK